MTFDCKTPFFVWFTGRTGSTYLCDLLNSHPQIHCRKEDFSEIRVEDDAKLPPDAKVLELNGIRFTRKVFTPSEILHDPSPEESVNYLNRLFSTGEDACGFKLKFPNQSLAYPEVMTALGQIKELKVIELLRSNALKQAISLRNVDRIQQLGVSKSGNALKQVSLEPLELDIQLTLAHARYFIRTRTEFRQQIESFANVHCVTYERLLNETNETMQSVLEFLNVDPKVGLASNFQKTTPDKLVDAIANYDELVAAVTDTELEQFLD